MKNIKLLSDLPDGGSAVIAKIKGQGAFKKRITEMGFVAGTAVTAIKKAPLQDPVEYEVMGYRVTLRLAEAKMIEVEDVGTDTSVGVPNVESHHCEPAPHRAGNDIRVALVGNPNSGKTTLFNRATGKHERVGNYGGVTVDIKTAHFQQGTYRVDLTDLPGTYSLSEYSPEEMFVRKHLAENKPDIVVNVVDASNLERNLFLTTQLMDMGLRVVIALNMYDELTARGDRFDYQALGEMLGIPILPTVACKGKGIGTLLDKIVDEFENPPRRTVTINYDKDMSDSDARYAFIRGALRETFKPAEKSKKEPKGYAPDRILTNKWLGIPLFLFFMWAMFQLTFTLGAYPMGWIESGVEALGNWLAGIMPDNMARDLVVDGVIGGVGGVIVFLPNILILFMCISFMEDTGYMARAAFIMDKAMHKIGLHGKSFIPMLMGFGCGVPAIMATRTLENRKDRILTMMAVPFMSCSARLPVYLLIVGAFFERHQGLVLLSIYVVGVLLACISSIVLGKIFFKKADAPFVMELPPYRVPTVRNIAQHTWGKSVQYLTKMGTVILAASVIVWALGYFPRPDGELPSDATAEMVAAAESERVENSYIGRIGHAIEPIMRPIGFDWKIGVCLFTGLGAKEIVVSSMGVLYQTDIEDGENTASLGEKLKEHFTPLTAYSFMLFILIYLPCFAALAAIRREAGWKWMAFNIVYTTILAWLVAFAVYQIGGLMAP